VLIAWVFFRADNASDAERYIIRLFAFSSGEVTQVAFLNFFHSNAYNLFVLMFGLLFCMPVFQKMITIRRKIAGEVVWQLGLIILFLASITYLSADTYNPFIYFRF
jgi:alginate O-acetyltransferase complex protein AlgI